MRHFSFEDSLFPARMIWVSAGPGAAPAAVSESADDVPEPEFTKENLDRAAQHFRGFFEEIGTHVIEREDLVDQLELALLTGQHVAVIGHPGTAKSTVARMVLDRIVDDRTGESSLFDKQFTADMRTGEVSGPNLPHTNPATGAMTMVRQFQQGIAPRRFALLDEGFDAPPSVLRGALLSVLLDRVIPDGNVKHPARLETAVLTSNKTLEQLRAKFQTELDALLDRFVFIFWTAKRTRRPASDGRIIKQRAERRSVTTKDPHNKLGLTVPPMQFSEIGLLKKAVSYVRERMKSDTDLLELAKEFYNRFHKALDDSREDLGKIGRSKIESPRSMNMLVDLLPAIAVLRYIQNPGTPLAVMPEDFDKLKLFFMMRGPVVADIPDRSAMGVLGDRQDEEVLGRLKVEDEVFRTVYRAVVTPAIAGRARNVPRDFAALTTAVNTVFDKVTQQPQTLDLPTTTTEINVLGGRLDQLEALAGQVPTGEELYVKAVSAFLYLLAHAVSIGGAELARSVFSDKGQKHVEKLKTSLFRNEIERSFEKFQEAVRQYHHGKIGRRTVLEAMLHHRDVPLYRPVLTEGEVGDIQEEISAACLATLGDAAAYEALFQPEEIAKQARELNGLYNFQKVLESLGLKGKIPFDKLVQHRTQMLKFAAAFLEKLKALIPQTSGADRDALLEYADTAASLYEDVLSSDDFSVPEKDRFPEDLIRTHIQKSADARAAAAPGSTVKVNIVPGNGEPHMVSVRYAIMGHEEKTIDSATLKQEFAQYAQTQLLQDERGLISRPEFQQMVAGLVREFKTYLGAEWDPSFEELILNAIAAAIRSSLQTGKDEWVVCPVERKNVKHRGVKLLHTAIKSSFDSAVAVFMADDGMLKIFMQANGMLPSDNNVIAFRAALTQGAATVQLETERVEAESIDIHDVAEETLATECQAWAPLRTAITASLGGIGDVMSSKMVDERRAKMAEVTAAAAGQPLTLDVLRRKYVETVGSADEAQSLAQRWPHLKISPLAGNADVLAELEADLKQYISDIPVDALRNMHDGGILGMFGGIPVLLEDNRLPEADWMSKLKDEVQAKVREYVNARTGHWNSVVATAGRDFTQIETAAATVLQDDLQLTDIQSLTMLDSRYTVEDAFIEQAKRDLVGSQLSVYADGIVAWVDAIQALELSDHGFRMADMTTLTPANANEVADYVRSKELFKKADEMLSKAEQAVAYYADYAPVDIAQRLSDIAQAKEALRNAFRTKVQDVSAGGI
ncbi:AAA family ATPase [Candidatus Peregrinibacteria bacterium]|nr:AAA family ATPase [Candidatus Peregrinibacteria bacterium]